MLMYLCLPVFVYNCICICVQVSLECGRRRSVAALTGRDFVTRSDQRALLTAPNLPVTNTRQILAAGQILTTQIETNMGQRYSENTTVQCLHHIRQTHNLYPYLRKMIVYRVKDIYSNASLFSQTNNRKYL